MYMHMEPRLILQVSKQYIVAFADTLVALHLPSAPRWRATQGMFRSPLSYIP